MRSSAEVHIGEKRDHKLTDKIQICYGEVVMQKKAWLPIKIISLLVAFLAFPRTAAAYYTNMPASVVVGQPDCISNSPGTSSTSLRSPTGIFVDDKGRLFVAEYNNNRVLIWNSIPTSNGQPADLVLGQPDFTSGLVNRGGSKDSDTLYNPYGVYSDGERLAVVEISNHRVLIWNTFPTSNGQPADVVVGSDSMTSGSPGCSQTQLSGPTGVVIYNNKLLISQASGRRVSIFNSVPTSNGQPADIVLGQDDFMYK